jgi:hypothetical protein
MKRFLALMSVVCAVLLLSAGAQAKPRCNDRNTVPPGNSEVDQYSETVPGDCGDRNPPTPSESDDPSETVPPATLAALEEQGADGRAAALLAAAGDRENGTGGSGAADGGGGQGTDLSANAPLGDTPAILDADDGGFFDSVVDALSGDGGLGWVLPASLVVILALAGVSFIRARRSA